MTWTVAGLDARRAYVVSQLDGRAAYGGTPSDQSVVEAIRDLKARGLKVMFYPFLFMDIAAGNALADPYTGAQRQPAYPWRGRITCDPAPGVSGSPDKTARPRRRSRPSSAAQRRRFHASGDAVVYSGPAEWSYRTHGAALRPSRAARAASMPS